MTAIKWIWAARLCAAMLAGAFMPQAAASADMSNTHSLIVLDPAVRMSEVLLEGVDESEVLRLDAGADPLQQILTALRERPDVRSLHVVSHGVAGNLSLGTLQLNAENLEENSLALREIGARLGENADLLFYACDVAGTPDGRAFVDALAYVTGIDVAASSNTTGHTQLGGDWSLEYSTGGIDATLPFAKSAIDGYRDMLSHFRGGSLTWQAKALDGDDVVNDVEITVKLAWRYNWDPMPVAVSLASDQAGFSAVKQSDDVIYVNGDASGADYALQTTVFRASNLDPATQYLVYYLGSARIKATDGLQNNAEGDWKIQTRIYLEDGNLAPKIDLPIIFEVPQLQTDGATTTTLTNWTFDLGSTDPNADKLRYRLANQSELGCDTAALDCKYTNPTGLSINPNTGLLTWTNSGNKATGLYSAGIVAEDVDESGNAKSKTHVDLLLSLVNKAQTEFTIDAGIPETRNVIVEKGDTFIFDISGTAIDTQSLGDIQGALTKDASETDANVDTYTFEPGVAGATTGPDLDPGTYPITFEVRDSTDSDSNNYLVLTFIVPDPDAPRIANLEADRVIYPGGAAVLVDADANAVVSDANTTDFKDGFLKLNVTFTDGQYEVLGVDSVGDGAGQIRRDGDAVYYGGVQFGTISSTLDGVGTALRVDFTGSTSIAALQALVRSLTYEDTFTLRAAGDRALSLYVRDPQGLSVAHDFFVDVHPDPAAPTMGGPVQAANQVTLVEGDAIALSNENISFADPDGDAITFTVTTVTNGHFAYVADTATSITSFTQAEINLGQVAFVHDGSETAPAYELSASDGESPAVAAPGTVNFTNVSDQPPTITNAPATTATEDSTYTYTPSVTDADANDTLTYSITNKPDWASFDTDTGTLTGTPDDGDAGTGITITVTDAGGATDSEGPFSITITPVNDAPAATNMTQSKTVTEGGAPAALDDIVVTDADNGETITATLTLSSITSGALSAGTFGSATSTFNAGTGVWTVTGSGADVNAALAATAFTPSANNDQDFTIATRIRDAANTGPADGTVSLDVIPVDDSPTDISLSDNTILQSSAGAGAAVGTLSTTDADTAVFTYTLVDASAAVPGTCAADSGNASFQIDGATLETAAVPAAGSHSLCIQTSDGTSSYKEGFTVTVTDDVAPAITSVGVPFDGTYVEGQNLDFTVNTGENVTISTSGGTPRMALTVGATTRYASYLSGSGTSALVFRYVVQSGDDDSDGISVMSLSANGGTLKDSAGNDLATTLNAVGSTVAVLVDTTAPSGHGVSFDDAVINGVEADSQAFTFSGAEIGATYDYTISSSSGGTNVTGSGTIASATQQITGIDNSGLNDGTLTLSVTLTDDAGNTASAVTDTATLDTAAPNGHGASFDDNVINGAEAGSQSFTFSGAEIGAAYGYTISSSSGGTNVTGSGTIASATQQITGINVSGLDDGTLTLSVTLTDEAGNAASAVTDTATLDTAAPSGQSVSFDDSVINDAEAASRSFTFNSAEVGADYSWTISSSGGGTDVTGSGNIASATQQITGVNVSGLNDGTLTLSVVLTDDIGNAASAVTDTATLDTVGPVPDIDSAATGPVSGAFTASIDFGETVTGFAVTDITAGNAALSGFTDNGGGSYSVTVTPDSDGTVTLDVSADAATDAAGNGNEAAVQYSIAFDGTAPAAPSAPDMAAADDHGASDTDNVTYATAPVLSGTAEAGATVTVSSDVDDVIGSVAANGAGAWSLAGYTALTEGAHKLTATATDSAGNTSAAGTALTVTIDLTDPSLTVSTPGNGATDVPYNLDTLELDFDETMHAGSVTTISIMSGADVHETVTVGSATFAGDGTVSVPLANELTPGVSYSVALDGQFADVAGNLSAWSGMTFTAYNAAPIAGDDTAGTNEDSSVAVDVLLDDSDAEGALNAASVTVTAAPAHGETSVNTASGVVTYTPDANYNGADSFTYSVKDEHGAVDTATVSITITAVNDVPQAAGDTPATNEDTAISIDVTFNDSDVDAGDAVDPTTIVIATAPANGTAVLEDGKILYTPDADFNGSDALFYTVKDGNGATSDPAKVIVTVTGINDAPDAVNDDDATDEDTAVEIAVLVNDTDVDGTLDVTSVEVLDEPANGTTSVAADGVITYTPNGNFNGDDSFTYVVKDDNGLSAAKATANIDVAAVNDAPDAKDDSVTVTEDLTTEINVLGNDADVDGSVAATTVELVTTPAEGSASVNATTGAITYTPGDDFSGADTFTYRVKDNSGAWSAPAAVSLNVTNVNDIPVAVADSATTAEDVPVVIDVIDNDTDVEAALIAASVTVIDAPDSGTATVNADGSVEYAPAANFHGEDTFSYTVEDDAAAVSNIASVTVTVTAVNDAPTIAGTPDATAVAGVAYTFAPAIADVDGDTLTVTATALPAWVSLDSGTGVLGGTPASGDVAAYPNIVITVSDGALDDSLAAFSIDVLRDTDGDTVADIDDADDDGDGIDDTDEGTGDTDDDGIPDSLDSDSDGDGIDDVSEGAADGDGDGVLDYLDTDSDDDGIDDATEGNVDTDGDGIADFVDTDSDNDRIDDAGEGDAATDTDSDGTPDYLDEDSDGDGIDDVIEGAQDSDGDGAADNLDADSDNDGIDDATEGNGDSDLDGTPDYLDTSIDEDGDGIPDIVEGTTDSDGDGDADFADSDSDNDAVPDALELDDTGTDADGDGISDRFDIDETGGTDANGDGIDDAPLSDADNDGRADSVDPDQDGDGIADGTESGGYGFDSDNDGIDDRWDADTSGNSDADGDGIGDDASLADSDADGDPDARDPDSDNDGVSDATESGASGIDADGDDIDDAFDADFASGTDANGDGVSDAAGARDSDGDGRPDYLDLDSDNDGITDVVEAGGRDADEDGLLDDGGTVTSTPRDTDGDGAPDLRDVDSDNDGVNDIEGGIYGPLDGDGDGRIDDHGDDTDGDGIADAIDSEPDQRGSRTDNDNDGVPVNNDQDDDGDGIPDSLEGGNDTDGDGAVDRLDRDGDDDGIPDSTEAGIPPATGSDTDLDGIDDAHDAGSTGGADANGDGIDDRFADRDTDGDGISDRMDNDSDNDGLPDAYESLLIEPSGADSDGDGIDDAIDADATNGADENGDGIDDAAINLADTDDDGIEDYRDPDSDNDGVIDGDEDGDFNSDGTNDRFQQDPGVETGLEGGGSIGWLVLAFLFAVGALRRVVITRGHAVVIALAGLIVALQSPLANAAAAVHADDARVEAGTASVTVPVTLSGFEGASDVVAVVSVPAKGGALSIDTAGLALELEYGYETFQQAGAIGFHGSIKDVSVALAERLTWHAPANVTTVELAISASEYQPDYFYNPDNGHYYKAVNAAGAITWTDARNAAAMETLHGMRGYLATVGSEAENIFVAHFVDVENVWLAASDSAAVINAACDLNLETTEGAWRWVAGPEACEPFWQGDGAGAVSEAGYASWEEGEPNNFRGGEHFAATNYQGVLGEWNDFAGNTPFVESYLVEFGGMPQDAGTLRTASGVATLEVVEAVPVAVAPPVVEPVVEKEVVKISDDVCVPGMLFINGCWSAGIGIVSSALEPDDARSGWKLVDDSDTGFKLAVEYRFFERWFLELGYADLGSAGLRNPNPAITGQKALDYKVPSLMAGYLLLDPASRFNVHLKAGYASLQNNFDAQTSSDQLHGRQLALGAGVRWRILPQALPDLRLQLEFEYYDKDATALGIMVMHAF